MTWSEYLDQRIEQGATPDLAELAIMRMMDIYESYGWDEEIPFDTKTE